MVGSKRFWTTALSFRLMLCTAVPQVLLPAPAKTAEEKIYIVVNQANIADGSGVGFDSVLEACRSLVKGNDKQILNAGRAYQKQFGKTLGVGRYPSQAATEKARWLRDWLSLRICQGSTIVLLGDEKSVPTWQVRLGRISLTTDSLYCDLDGDGVPDTAVSRILGTPAMMVRQLQGKKDYGSKAVILCSEDTRIHLETRAFTKSLSQLGYDVAIRGARDDETLTGSDFIIHFGHGSASNISNRFGETFVATSAMPALPRSPIVFVDGCGTLPVDSPLLHSFLEQGAIAYVGSTATVHGMTPARFTNELVEHFLHLHAERPRSALAQLLMAARAAYVQGHPGLSDKLSQLGRTGRIDVSGDVGTHILTVAEWVYYGDPRAVMPRIGSSKQMSRQAFSLAKPTYLDEKNNSWQVSFSANAKDGQAVLSLYADITIPERGKFLLSVRQNNEELSRLDGRHDTMYQHIGEDCRGGYISRDTYRARFLLPLLESEGKQHLEVRLVKGTSTVLRPGTEVDVWPLDFEERIGLRRMDPARRKMVTRQPVKVVGVAKLRSTGVPEFFSINLSSFFNRLHNSVLVGGGDNASFKTWFSQEKVLADGIPFLVRRTGSDVLVSENNTQNVYEIKGIEASACALHFLVWGYNNPRQPATLRVTFSDGSSQECELHLSEWTRGVPAAAFDFENTIQHFKHAAVAHQVINIAYPEKKIISITSTSGTYGLIAITLEKN